MSEIRALLQNTAKRWMDEIWRDRNLTHFDTIHADNFIDHSPEGRDSSRLAYKQSILDLFIVFPDFTATTEDMVIDTETRQAAVRWKATGTFSAPFLGFSPTGKIIYFQGIEIITIDHHGAIVKRWGEWDGLNIRDQLSSP